MECPLLCSYPEIIKWKNDYLNQTYLLLTPETISINPYSAFGVDEVDINSPHYYQIAGYSRERPPSRRG